MALDVRPSPIHGRGVFTTRAQRPGAVLETAPVILLDPDDAELVATTLVGRYVFDWGDGRGALCLGWISMCNHAAAPNAEVVILEDLPGLQLVATRWLAPSAEVLIDYGPAAPQ